MVVGPDECLDNQNVAISLRLLTPINEFFNTANANQREQRQNGDRSRNCWCPKATGGTNDSNQHDGRGRRQTIWAAALLGCPNHAPAEKTNTGNYCV